MSSASRYSTGAIAFHWIIAALIALNFVAVWVAERMPKPEHMQIMANHMAFGLTILVLSVISVLWRLFHPRPPYVATIRPWEAMLARIVQTLFWFLIIAMPITGWGMVTASPTSTGVSWFGLFTVPPLPFAHGSGAGGTFHDVHETFAWLMLGLIALHVAGALKHQLFDRDGTLGRMVPFMRKTDLRG